MSHGIDQFPRAPIVCRGGVWRFAPLAQPSSRASRDHECIVPWVRHHRYALDKAHVFKVEPYSALVKIASMPETCEFLAMGARERERARPTNLPTPWPTPSTREDLHLVRVLEYRE